jgi:hypothetical protein
VRILLHFLHLPGELCGSLVLLADELVKLVAHVRKEHVRLECL